MNGLERTNLFLRQDAVDRPPFHPIIMRWAARYAGVPYRDFCLDPRTKCDAMIRCARDFGLDWVTVMSDPWAEATAFGIQVDYPADQLPAAKNQLPDAASAAALKPWNPADSMRCRNRLKELEIYQSLVADEFFIVGWIEGPVASYANLRGTTGASIDFLMEPDLVEKAMDIITESAIGFIRKQVDQGAHCIGIGDAFCSQIGPDLYHLFAFDRQKQLVDVIHSGGALAKLHICGNTRAILPSMIATGADIIDIDHLVPSMAEFSDMLGPNQVFSGKSDPVSVIQDGTAKTIENAVRNDITDAGGRCIVSAGCEITPDTSAGNMRAFRKATENLI